MSTCHGCGGVIGRDCFDPSECSMIARDKASQFDGFPCDPHKLLEDWHEALDLLRVVDAWMSNGGDGNMFALTIQPRIKALIGAQL